jgi:photosystem II stability/assembly factor-like uncharacterized protein
LLDAAGERVFVFRGQSVLAVDTNSGAFTTEATYEVPATVCYEPRGNADIASAVYDPARNILYPSFVTYVCTPWVNFTIVSHDLNSGERFVAGEGEPPFDAVAHDGRLFGKSWFRLGRTFLWHWRDGRPVASISDDVNDFSPSSSGLFVDAGRGLIYESVTGALRLYALETMERVRSVVSDVPGRLIGFDSLSDNLYFMDGAEIRVQPAAVALEAPLAPTITPLPPAAPQGSIIWGSLVIYGDIWAALWRAEECPGPGGSLYLSEDRGASWRLVDISPNGGDGCGVMRDFAISTTYSQDKQIFGVADGVEGVWLTTDAGLSWQPATAGLAVTSFRELLLSPAYFEDRTIFARATDGALFRSVDSGASWEPLNVNYEPLALSPGFGQDRTIIGAAGAALYVSRDAGLNWEWLSATPGEEPMTMLVLVPREAAEPVIFAYGESGTLTRSLDGGESWVAVLTAAPGPTQFDYDLNAGVGGPLFFLTRQALYRSTDGGASWADVGFSGATAIVVGPNFASDGLIYAGTLDGQIVAATAPP